ncbi:cysteine synthase A [Haliangium ochraceum]|uniref:Cysteine synthase n=1 Tax=Haliangium ochraceum (strain DSM 14365 / JCM 11303 / SMP-2) TaxID=502025 RepID=D0LHJ6_HALO1|nr:cysteine synthase A [Haliangium ochraceum]ACY12858.1 cysteine synthase A [Haliangium ochraceum DSM 14365]
MPIYDSVVDTVGGTPLIRLQRLGKDLHATILGKMESRNPCGSIKDRVGVALLRDAAQRGALTPGAVIVEATSGNTGIALAFAAAAMGYRLIITMPETMSRERVALLRTFGVEVVLTRGGMMRDAVSRAKEIARETPGAVTLEQFRNPANPDIHAQTTAREILDDTEGKIDAFVAGVGTGGTVSGVGRVLKDVCPNAKIIAVEPADSAVLSGKPPAPHYIQGIGAGFIPENLNLELIDEIVAVSERAALDYTRRLAREEGIFAGLSSGAAVAAAARVAARKDMKGKQIVVILPDTGERYLSSTLGEELGA